jgi:hypothetical protein
MDEAGPSVFQGNDDFFPFISTNQKKQKKLMLRQQSRMI